MQILPDRIIWNRDDFLTGFIPDPSSSFRYNENGAANMSNVDVFTTAPGTLIVGRDASSVGTVNTTVLISSDFDPSGDFAYVLGTDLHRFDVANDTLTKNATWPHDISHSSHGGESGTAGQVVFYHTSGTARVILFSFNDGTDASIGSYDIVANAFNDNFLETVPTSGTLVLAAGRMHPLAVVSDDRCLIGDYTSNQGRIHSYNGPANTVSQNVLNLPYNMEPVGIVEEENGFDTVVFATNARGKNRRGSSRAFWWSIDRPASWYKSSPIPDDECAAPFAAFGTVGCFTKSRTTGAKSTLRILEGGQWIEKFHWTGSLPVLGGVDVQDDTVVWNSDGKRYRWGTKWGKYPVAAFQESSGSGSTSGLLKSFSNSTDSGLYMSSGTGVSGLEKFANFSTGNWQGASAAPIFPKGKKGKINSVQTHLVGGSAGGGRSLKLSFLNEAFIVSEVFSGFTSFTSDEALLKHNPESFTNRLIEFSALAPKVEWETGSGATNASGVERIEVFYDSVDINN